MLDNAAFGKLQNLSKKKQTRTKTNKKTNREGCCFLCSRNFNARHIYSTSISKLQISFFKLKFSENFQTVRIRYFLLFSLFILHTSHCSTEVSKPDFFFFKKKIVVLFSRKKHKQTRNANLNTRNALVWNRIERNGHFSFQET